MFRIAFLVVLAWATCCLPSSAQVLPGRPGTIPKLIVKGPTRETEAKLKQLRKEERRLRRESAKPSKYMGPTPDDIPLLAHDDYAVREAAHNRLLLAINEHDEDSDVASLANQLISEATHSTDPESQWRCWLILNTHLEYRQTVPERYQRWKLLKESNTVVGDVWVLLKGPDPFKLPDFGVRK